ncbi:hypothetical protein LZ30DRAFT_785816 [Colletotrichum cereale]|nr:hypothetical protein LZ30DRAFT_785816 [Colletotrichum cereale]
MYKTAPSQHHLQLAAPSPYPGLEGSRNAAPRQSPFGDSDNASDWSDSESEESTCRDDRASTGAGVNVITRRHRRLPRRDPVPNETYADQGGWDENRYTPRSGGQAVPYTPYGLPTRPFPPTGDLPYSQPQAPLGTHPQSQHHPPRSDPLPPGQNDMAHENPFAPLPRSVPWNGHQAGPYGNSPPAPVYEPHPPWHRAAEYGYAPPNPAHFSAVPPGPYPYPNSRAQYYGGYAPAHNPPDPPLSSEPAPPPRRRRRRPPQAEASPQEHELDRLQRRLRTVEIDGQHAEDLRQAKRERAQAERQQWEMERLRQDIERSFKTDIRDAVDDIRREIHMSQSEWHSDPGRAPSRMDGGGGEQDVLMQEVKQFIEGKRRLQPQDQAPGAAFRNGSQAGPGSARESRIDPELRSELESIVYDILGGSDVAPRRHRRASSRSVHGRAASDGFHPRVAATRVDHRDWRRETYDGGVRPAASADPVGLGRSPVRVAFDQNGYAGPSAAATRPTDERDWLGVPRKSRRRPRREDAGVPGPPQVQEAGLHRQPQRQPPPQASNARYHSGASAPHPGSWGVAGGGEEAVFSARAMAYQDSISNNGARLGGLGPGQQPAGPASRRGAYGRAVAHEDEDEDTAAFFTDDESDGPEVFPKRDASYPEFPAGHPDLRHRVQLPRAPKPPYLRQAGM